MLPNPPAFLKNDSQRWVILQGAVVDCLPQLRKLLGKTTQNSVLLQACNFYLYIIVAWKALANFT